MLGYDEAEDAFFARIVEAAPAPADPPAPADHAPRVIAGRISQAPVWALALPHTTGTCTGCGSALYLSDGAVMPVGALLYCPACAAALIVANGADVDLVPVPMAGRHLDA